MFGTVSIRAFLEYVANISLFPVKSISFSVRRLVSILAFVPPAPTYTVQVKHSQTPDGMHSRIEMFLNDRIARIMVGKKRFTFYKRILADLQEGIDRKLIPFFIISERGNRLFCILIRPPSGQKRYTIIHNHQNGTDIGIILGSLCRLSRRTSCNILAYDYSGYGLSGGKPSERNLYCDIESVVKFVVCENKINPNSIILYGQSIGSVPAIAMASLMNFAGVILHAPILSGLRTVWNYKRTTWAFDPFPNIIRISDVDCPVLVIHGVKDDVIGVEHGIELYRRCKHKVKPLWIPEANHHNIRLYKEYFTRINEFLNEI